MQNRQQAIIWTNADSIHWSIYVALWGDELRNNWWVTSILHFIIFFSGAPQTWRHNIHHYDDIIMTTVSSQITSLAVVYSIVYSGADERKHQTPRHWPLCGEFTGTGEFPAQRASNAENVPIWWRHHDYNITVMLWLCVLNLLCFFLWSIVTILHYLGGVWIVNTLRPW